MNNTYKQVIRVSQNARKSLELLDALPYDNNRTLFVIAEHSNKLLGTITDGDIRRGLLGGLENMALAPAWRDVTRVIYPYDLPTARAFRLNYPLRWFKVTHIPVVAERIQVDTYIACQVLSEAIGHVQGDFVRDYLLEQIENMLSNRILNGYYNRLSLGPGQRFASKGGYFVRFSAAQGKDIVADGDWTVP